MVGLKSLFGGRSLDAVLAKARQRLAAGDFDQAHRIVEEGLQRFPDAEALRETDLTIRRAQARAGMQSLKSQIARNQDPVAYEQLVTLYQEVGMPGEALREARAYAGAHPDRDTPHLLLGEMHLQSFFMDLVARDAHTAHDHLVRAARLNPEAVKPRLLLAELYFCAGADRALHVIAQSLARFAQAEPAIQPVLDAIAKVPQGGTPDSLDGVFERIEVRGALLREATDWPVRHRRNREARQLEERTVSGTRELVEKGEADEVVVLRRGGGVLAHATQDGTWDGKVDASAGDASQEAEATGMVDIARVVARSVAPKAREFDLGAFKRCTVQGGFGTIVVGEAGGVVIGARSRSREPLRLWERVTLALDRDGGASS